MALFKKNEKAKPGAPESVGPGGKPGSKKRLPLFLAIILILAGGAYVYMNYFQPKPKTPTYRPRRRVAKKKKPEKKAVKKPEPRAEKKPEKKVKAVEEMAAKKAAAREAAGDRPTYEELEDKVKSLESKLAALESETEKKKRPPEEYRRLRAIFRKVERDGYPGSLVGSVKEVAPGTVSFTLPELRGAGVEQVLVTSLGGEREVTVVTTEESKITNRIGWSGGLWSYSRNDGKDLLNGLALGTATVEEYLEAREAYRKAVDAVYRALAS